MMSLLDQITIKASLTVWVTHSRKDKQYRRKPDRPLSGRGASFFVFSVWFRTTVVFFCPFLVLSAIRLFTFCTELSTLVIPYIGAKVANQQYGYKSPLSESLRKKQNALSSIFESLGLKMMKDWWECKRAAD